MKYTCIDDIIVYITKKEFFIVIVSSVNPQSFWSYFKFPNNIRKNCSQRGSEELRPEHPHKQLIFCLPYSIVQYKLH